MNYPGPGMMPFSQQQYTPQQNPFGQAMGRGMQQPQFGMQQPSFGGGFGMQQPRFGMQQPSFGGGFGMQQPSFGGFGGGFGMQPPQFGGGFGMQQPSFGGFGGFGMQQPGFGGGFGMQPPQFGGGFGMQQPGFGMGMGGFPSQRFPGLQVSGPSPFQFGQPPQFGGGFGGGFGMQPPRFGGRQLGEGAIAGPIRPGGRESLVGETPRYDFTQARPTERPKTLRDVLGAAGFQMPERPRISTSNIAFFGKDPVTGEMRRGGSSDSNYYKQLDAMYAQNPEALKIAKQFEADRVAKANQKPSNRFSALASRVRQGPPSSMRDLQQSFDREINSPQYQALVQRYGQSMGQDQGALGQLQAIQARMQQQQDAMLDMPRAITGREQLMRGRSPVYQGPTLQNPPRNPYAQ